MSKLVEHAKRELELIGEDPEAIADYLKVIQAFADCNHSGGSAAVAIPTINKLLQFENLSPLTDNPDEWQHHTETVWGEEKGIWQSVRRPDAFSVDGGKTYYLLNEERVVTRNSMRHVPALQSQRIVKMEPEFLEPEPSRVIHIGDMQPGESVTLEIDVEGKDDGSDL